MKEENAQKSLLPDLIALMSKMIEQNSLLIEQAAAKEQFILQLIDQNNEILSELAEQYQEEDNDDDERPASTYLDG
ncbi:hypothetical protein ACTXGW_01580 [Psychrobacter faecalis]|uniref:hypothetical protein n=1 Tax=Psychrobacter faecalis TaxID=180588 RepID=UPI003FD35720